MKRIEMYELGETVLIEAKIAGLVVENGEIKYKLKNPLTGKDYEGYLYSGDQLRPEPENIKVQENRRNDNERREHR